jgi:ABC-type glutathione transport system ATPase component
MNTLMEVRGLTLQAGDRTLVRDLSWTVRRGQITALVGASGSGKTISVRTSMGIIDVEPGVTSGSLFWPEHGDQDWFDIARGPGGRAELAQKTRALRGGYVTYSPQSASSGLNPGRTIGRQIAMAIARRKVAPPDLGRAVVDVLAEVGLPARAAVALPGELSGGMAQRAALAIAVAPEPSVLIADEPETGLDPILRRMVTELMLTVARQRQVGLLLISHHHDTVDRVAHDVIRLGGHR